MARPFQQIRLGTLNDDAVRAKTGKSWEEWCKLLDKAGGRMMDPPEIALFLKEEAGLSRWWSQMVAAGYENERGIRQDHRGATSQRFEVTLTKIVAVPRASVWAAWQDPGTLARWLPGVEFVVAKTVPFKLLDLDWPDETRVAVRLYERRGKTRLVVSHGRLTEAQAAHLQEYWWSALDRLMALMGRPSSPG